ncbi:hypothetical protein EZS27_023341 [termite gut metagenome]|uniref:Uncharacterized protein n=1 Tax=termite gut metagenome TaxID=433724 RepID=A0A5J4R3Z1_9ZZZZ
MIIRPVAEWSRSHQVEGATQKANKGLNHLLLLIKYRNPKLSVLN